MDKQINDIWCLYQPVEISGDIFYKISTNISLIALKLFSDTFKVTREIFLEVFVFLLAEQIVLLH